MEAGQVVFREGDHSDTCYVVCGGHCRATREHGDSRRLRVANERIASQSFQTVQSRVATVLSELATWARTEQHPPGDVVVTATQAEVAQPAGSSRESASRFLAVLERAGVVTQGRGRITLHDPGALQG